MRVKVWKLGTFDDEVEVPIGATAGEAIDAAGLSFAGHSVIVNGIDASLGMTLTPNDVVFLVPTIMVIEEKLPRYRIRPIWNEEELERLFFCGVISVPEYCRRLSAFEARRGIGRLLRLANLLGFPGRSRD